MEKRQLMKGKFDQLTSGPTSVLVDFYATWRRSCMLQLPVIKKWPEKLKS